jgi:hypothetical protein
MEKAGDPRQAKQSCCSQRVDRRMEYKSQQETPVLLKAALQDTIPLQAMDWGPLALTALPQEIACCTRTNFSYIYICFLIYLFFFKIRCFACF